LSVNNINALACKTIRASSPTFPTDVILDSADGLEWATLVRCDAMHFLPRSKFGTIVGSVSHSRRRAIARKIIECFHLSPL
jgi:hypothetical protein